GYLVVAARQQSQHLSLSKSSSSASHFSAALPFSRGPCRIRGPDRERTVIMLNWNPSKQELLKQTIEHIDVKRHNVVPLVEAMKSMAYSARDLARAADIYDRMVRDPDCGIIVCLAGSLMSAGLKQVIIDMINTRMCDAIVSTGANIAD